MDQLLPLNNSDRKHWLNNITENIQNQNLTTPIIEIEHINRAIKVNIS